MWTVSSDIALLHGHSLLIYEEMAQALYLGFPISLQNCAGLGYRCHILRVGALAHLICSTGSHSVTGTTVGDQIHFLLKDKFFWTPFRAHF